MLGLSKKEMDKNTLIENLVKKVNKLEEENKSIKNEINGIKEKQKNFEILFEEDIQYKKFIQKRE